MTPRRLLIGLVFGGLSLFGLVRSWEHGRRPAYESHITGDAGARAGLAMVEAGRHEAAIGVLERALQKPLLEVQTADVFMALGAAYEGMDREGKGESQRHKGLVYEGLAHRLRGDYGPAEAAFKNALALHPDHAVAYESLGSLLLVMGRHAEAVVQLELAVGLDAANAITRANLTLAYAGAGRFTEAELQYLQAERHGYPKLERLRELLEALRAGRGGTVGP